MADRALARKVLQTEAAAVLALADRLDERFDRAVNLLKECRGRVILTGMGKSGIICQKIAATLSSTGTPAHFLHPADAIHGDLGMIQADDVVIALSYSGETDEIIRLLEFIRRLGAKLIAITGGHQSALAQAADVALVGVITDGDLRRQIEKGVDVRGLRAVDVMTRGPISVQPSTLGAEALNIMETRHITSLVVVDGPSNHVAGVVHLHDLWRTEMF